MRPRSIADRASLWVEVPSITVADIVTAQKRLLEHLGVTHLRAVVGPSYGGFQAFQWAVTFPDFMDGVVPVVTSPLPPASDRIAGLMKWFGPDPNWNGGDYYDRGGVTETLTALRVDTLTRYGLGASLAGQFPDPAERERELHRIAATWAAGFDANSLFILGHAMERYDITPDYGRIKVPVLYVLSRTDALFPPNLAPVVIAGLRAPGWMRRISKSTASMAIWRPARMPVSGRRRCVRSSPGWKRGNSVDLMMHDGGAVDDAITSRRSIRRFLPTPVPRATVAAILEVAARAPSGTNMQPWRGYVVAGAARDALCAAVQAVFDRPAPDGGADEHTQEVRYYPETFFEPYLSRRRAIGWELYGLLGIARGETAKMRAQHRRNFQFFDAPVGMIFTIDRRLATGSWLDYGMFLENLVIAARGRGLDTCAQAAWAHYHKAIRPVLGLAAEEIVVCGMALGHADPEAPENTLVTPRVPAGEFMRFDGFDAD